MTSPTLTRITQRLRSSPEIDSRATSDEIVAVTDTSATPQGVEPKYPVDSVPSPVRLVIFGLQHLLVMYASTVTVPVVVASALNLSTADLVYLVTADLLLCGFGTILQSLGIWKVGVGLPMVIGASYTGIAPMLIIGQGSGLQTMYGAVLVVGLATIAVAPLVSKVMKYFPPVVIGTTILLIGIQLIPAGGKMIVGANPTAADFASPSAIGLAAATALAILLCYRFLPQGLRPVAVLAGMVCGIVVAAVSGKLDFSSVGGGRAFSVPDLLHFGAPRFDLLAICSLAIIQIVLIVELAGQVNAVGDVVGKTVPPHKLAAAVRADGVVNALGGGLFQSFMYVTFAQNVGILTLTKVFSRYVTVVTGAMLMGLAFFPVVGQVVAAIPRPVLGAAAVVMFGTIAVVGIRILGHVDFTDNANVIVTAAALGIALLPTTISGFYSQFPAAAQQVLSSGVATGICVAILLNLAFTWRKNRESACATH
ncbi:nucleobase:cation symporter-2 family protein [Gordonia rhizosphera]|uniref:Putative transporter n=1 Tax=Gordonia rhizosphera NBRC 16068 TaxID=1108045 RepID=K6V7H6_9ACTN|nr:nucleobase:cation symporter-2 family protein [Gordonia rhizosphera]GAB92183.1 putative transporter [Gordonia rhizosphera NBRC 16068]